MRNTSLRCLIVLGVIISIVCSTAIAKGSFRDILKSSYGTSVREGTMENRVVVIGDEVIAVSYLRTENRSDLRLEERLDKYGTYDIYVDENGTEHTFLVDSDIYCGFMKQNVGLPVPDTDVYPEEEAIEKADELVTLLYDNSSDYVFQSAAYYALGGYYDIVYAYLAGDHKTDDVIRIWVDSTGAVTAYSDFNRARYYSEEIRESEVSEARSLLQNDAEILAGDGEYSVIKEYISTDERGRLALAWDVQISIPIDEEYATVYGEKICRILH